MAGISCLSCFFRYSMKWYPWFATWSTWSQPFARLHLLKVFLCMNGNVYADICKVSRDFPTQSRHSRVLVENGSYCRLVINQRVANQTIAASWIIMNPECVSSGSTLPLTFGGFFRPLIDDITCRCTSAAFGARGHGWPFKLVDLYTAWPHLLYWIFTMDHQG